MDSEQEEDRRVQWVGVVCPLLVEFWRGENPREWD